MAKVNGSAKKIAKLPEHFRGPVAELIEAGLSWEQALVLVRLALNNAPAIIDIIKRLLDQIQSGPVGASGHCTEHVKKQRESLLCALACNYCMEHDCAE